METRRAVMKYLAGAMGASACGLDTLEAFARGLAADTSRPNIVCLVGEGLRWDEFSSSGNKLLKTPNMDRIGREGITFRNAFVVNALCLPSRASILTGLYSHSTGAIDNRDRQLPPEIQTFADLLREAGYDVAFIGKSHVKALSKRNWDY